MAGGRDGVAESTSHVETKHRRATGVARVVSRCRGRAVVWPVYGDGRGRRGRGAVGGESSADWWRPTRTLATWLTWLLVAQAAGQALSIFRRRRVALSLRMHACVRRACSTAATRPRDGSSSTRPDGTDQLGRAGVRLRGVGVDGAADHLGVAERAQRPRARAEAAPGWPGVGRSSGGSSRSPSSSCCTSSSPISGAARPPTLARGDGWRASPPSPLVAGWWVVYVGAQVLDRPRGRPRGHRHHRPSRRATSCSRWRTLVGIGGAAAHARGRAPDHRAPGGAAGRRPGAHRRARSPRQYHVPDHRRRARVVRRPGRPVRPPLLGRRAWTEHVSRAGVASTAPVTPPDWYPDPTGRFHWRYWTGQRMDRAREPRPGAVRRSRRRRRSHS